MAVGEWDQRQLCSDGACVGVIGPDGTCRVCGRAAQNWGDERKRGLIDPPDEAVVAAEADEADALAADAEAQAEADAFERDEDDELDDDELEDDGVDDLDDEDGDDGDDGDDPDEVDHAADAATAAPASGSLVAAPVEWGTRQLCPDGACIGVLGADRRCKVCGRRASGTSPATASGTADSGFAVVTTDDAVATTDDAVQTVASTITTDPPSPDVAPPDALDEPLRAPPASPDPDSKEPA